MSETKHTPEPWRAVNGFDRRWRIHSETVSHLAEVSDPGEANAHRIVLCINACAGIPDEVLTAPGYSIKDELDSLDAQIAIRMMVEQERDRFRARLAALEEVATGLDADIDSGRPLEYNVEHLRDELIRARMALGIVPDYGVEYAVGPKEDHDAAASAVKLDKVNLALLGLSEQEIALLKDKEYIRKLFGITAPVTEEVNDFRMDELDAVMHSVDKWLEGDDLKNNPATRAADAREIALKAIEAETARADMAEASLKIVADVAVAWVNRNLCDEHMPIMCKALEEDGLRAAIMGVKA